MSKKALLVVSFGTSFDEALPAIVNIEETCKKAFPEYDFFRAFTSGMIIRKLKRTRQQIIHSPEEIMELEKKTAEAPQLREAQKALAEELTLLVHGEEGLAKAQRITETFFHGDIMSLSPQEIKEGLSDAISTQIEDGTPLIDALVAASICKSKGDARRLIQQGSISVNGEKKSAIDFVMTKEDALNNEFSIVRKGKKNWYLFTF